MEKGGKVMTLADLIISIESNGDKRAMRFEEGFYNRVKDKTQDTAINRIQRIHKCSRNTACMIASTSWGLFQIMGYNIYFYSLYDAHITKFVDDVVAQIEAFHKFIKGKGIDYTVEELKTNEAKLKRFASIYNGDVDGYSKKIKQRLGI